MDDGWSPVPVASGSGVGRVRLRRRVAAVVIGCVVAVVLAGCGEDRDDSLGPSLPQGAAPPGGTAVNGIEEEWKVGVDLDSVPAGPVTFTFYNAGTIVHEMLVVRSDLAVGALPVDPGTGRFAEESDRWQVVDEIPEYAPGETKALTVTLEPGTYQLVCNIPSHYVSGMATGFTVSS
ncbi:MAG: hypothetical protein WD023_05070 [Ilumatobacteraceae bacterium]